MVDVKALRELAEEWEAKANPARTYYERKARSPWLEGYEDGLDECARELLALLAEPGDDALPEGWEARPSLVPGGTDYIGHALIMTILPGEAVFITQENGRICTATELHAVLSYHLRRRQQTRNNSQKETPNV